MSVRDEGPDRRYILTRRGEARFQGLCQCIICRYRRWDHPDVVSHAGWGRCDRRACSDGPPLPPVRVDDIHRCWPKVLFGRQGCRDPGAGG